ncbi:hypothetical protein [Bacillus solitudinis]|uniref:hypothetical protein n=1 Tax=Bacillus solitudinis TaxID=2014074 RepID=UPI000C235C66|nr:hypothetical protein [Bacillus solitudinis]
MKKGFLILMTMLILVVVGYSGYQFAMSYASEKMMEHVTEELLTDETVEVLLNDPIIKKVVSDLNSNELNNTEVLPFTTKEEGLKVVLAKFSASELKDIALKVQSGLTKTEQQQLINEYQNRLSEEELQALLLIGIADYMK